MMKQQGSRGRDTAPASNSGNAAPPIVPPDSDDESCLWPSPEAIVKEIVKAGATFFLDDLGRAYASIPCREPMPHRENWPLSYKSKTCRRLLRSLIPIQLRGSIQRQCFREAIDLMEAIAADRTQEVTLANRISRSHDGSILIDMADPCWRAIQVSEKGWSVQDTERAVFRRHKHQRALPTPIPGGDINRLFDFVPTAEQKDRLLTLAWLVSALVPDVMTPIMLRIGQPGGAKSTTSMMLRSLIDPSTTEILGEAERGQLVQVMFHHAIPCFDNLGRFGRNDADFFCRAVTGVGFEKRQLFTDMDEVLLKFKRSIILNGVTLPTTRPDFLDRSLVFHIDRLKNFRPRNEIEDEFRSASPLLLGALLDLLVETLKHLPSTSASTEFRMADFARLGRAVARALKQHDRDFDDAYRSTLQHQADDALDADPFANAVVSYVQALKKEVETTAAEFLEKLTAFAKEKKLEHSGKFWPGGPRWVTTRLTELVPVFSVSGVRFERLPRENKSRKFRLSCVQTDAATSAATSSTSPGDVDEEAASCQDVRSMSEERS